MAKEKGKAVPRKEAEVTEQLVSGRRQGGVAQPGSENVSFLVDHIVTKKDHWLIFELGGASLSKLLVEIKGEFYRGERVYRARKKEFYLRVMQDQRLLRVFIR